MPRSLSVAGACLWFTGLSGAGKSITATAVADALTARGRRCTVLDGDEVRRKLSADLGFSRADRNRNVLRVAGLALELVDSGDVVLCALISPYRDARDQARQLIGHERFLEIFVDSPLEVCEARDPKGLYQRARQGLLSGLTGVDDPYEPPLSPDLVLTTTDHTVEQNAARVIDLLWVPLLNRSVAAGPGVPDARSAG